ncbi:2666_t:CDS:2, partial [Acaulospora colombiana]
DQDCKGYATDCDTTGNPRFWSRLTRREEDIPPERERVAGRETKQYHLGENDGGGEAKLDVDGKATEGEDSANNPKDQANTDGTSGLINAGGGTKNTSSNHLVNDDENGAGDSELARFFELKDLLSFGYDLTFALFLRMGRRGREPLEIFLILF